MKRSVPQWALLICAVALAGCDATGLSSAPPVADGPAWGAMLGAVNDARARGASCGGEWYPAAQPLVWDSRLERAARRHSRDMAENDFFGHRGTDGDRAGGRVRDAGYDWRAVGENIARYQRSVGEVVGDWMSSEGHCRQIMSATYLEVGAAEVDGYWTQVFATAK